MKIIGLDVGSKTIGVAVSDAFGWTAQGLTTIKWDENDIHSADTALKEIITEHEIGKAVIGLPKNMNGTIGERGKASEVLLQLCQFHVQLLFLLMLCLQNEYHFHPT